ncbi:MAG TPA: hypothetical protein ENN28_03420, partial [Candidatus Uhrbacteria bacterium]|nr:hypothetical protein [Candidatus Uhrbacteria bacterium]
MQYSVINYKTVKENSDFRIDAEYYYPEKLNSLKILKNNSNIFLSDIILSIKKNETPKDFDVEIYDTGAASSHILTKNLAQTEERISLKRKAKSGDVIISRLRPYLKQIAYIPTFIDKAYLTTEFFVLRGKDKESISFLTPFLLTKFVQKILFWGQGGTQHPRFQEYDLLNLPIPKNILGLKEVLNKIVSEYCKLVLEADHIYSQAEQLLLSELGLLDWKPKHTLSFVKNFSDTKESDRFDAEYFQPKYDEIVEAVKKYKGGFDELGNLVKIKKSIEPGSEAYQENGIPFVRVSNLSKFELSDNNQQFISEELYNELKTHQPKKGEILLSKDATPGMAYFLNEEPQKMIVSGGILRLKIDSKQILPEYLTLVLNSVIAQKQIERD